jgi:hypothetical protein
MIAMNDQPRKWFIPEHIWRGILIGTVTLIIAALTGREYSQGATKWRLIGGILMTTGGALWSAGHFADVNMKKGGIVRRLGRILLWAGLGLLFANRY